MKRVSVLSFVLTFAFLFASAVFVNAQPVVKQKTKRIINNTAVEIHKAHKETMVHKVFTGKLKKAIAHQRFAIYLYQQGRYMRAMHHSRRARILAHQHLEANLGVPPKPVVFGPDEKPDGMIPPDAELDKALEEHPEFMEAREESGMIEGPLENIDIKE
ncbi:MAG: hypothetical protein C0592_00130 [Marinilabiliales bacterium]|nr:MAG: hypothetical protein C0592_00130 [Marinilabiliales bacterium]